jgi:IMP dehydrogenase
MEYLFDALTFDDVLLVPGKSNVLPKVTSLETCLTKEISLKIPLLSAAMDTVTESALAIAIAEKGGIGILHKNMAIAEQAKQVDEVKKHESHLVRYPITVTPKMTLSDVRDIQENENISGLPVLEGKRLMGIITRRDIRFESNLSQKVSLCMTPREKLVTARENISHQDMLQLFKTHRIEKLPLVNDAFELIGIITAKDVLMTDAHSDAARDTSGRLYVGAAVGIGSQELKRAEALTAAGVDVLVVDTAHGHSQGVLNQVKAIKKRYGNSVQLIAGNIATGDAAEALIACGVDAVKVGVGPGSICTTRVVTGVGMPQISAIYHVACAAKRHAVPVIADGGIRFSGDVCKALAAGANTVMIGGLFAGTAEAPGASVRHEGQIYKIYRGMGSLGAMSKTNAGSYDRYFQDKQTQLDKYIPEGIEGCVPYSGKLAQVIHQLLGGIRASLGYLGCRNLSQLHKNAQFVRVSAAGMREGHAHDIVMTKQAPNY